MSLLGTTDHDLQLPNALCYNGLQLKTDYGIILEWKIYANPLSFIRGSY